MTDVASLSAINPRHRRLLTQNLSTVNQPVNVSLYRNCRATRYRFPVTFAGKAITTVSVSTPLAKQEEHAMRETDAFNQRDWASGYSNHKMQPDGYWIDVEGTLPPELTGTYYRNGPGTYKLGQHELAHPFDGHGFILSVAIKNGKAFARTRFVETPEYKREVGRQEILFRGSFGTQKPGGFRRNAFDIFMKNAANTNVIYFEGRLLALFEAAQPIAMNPYSLETLGPDLLGGNVKTGASFDFGQPGNQLGERFFKAMRVSGYKYGGEHRLGGEAVTAHPKYDLDTGRWVFYKFQVKASLNPLQIVSGQEPVLTAVITFFELDQNMKEVSRVELRTPGYTFLHDFALTPTHIVVMISPVAQEPTRFLLGLDSAAASVKWQDGKTSKVHLLGRPVVDAPAPASPAQRHLQQQQQQGQQKQQQGVHRIRHKPEHLVSQVPAGFVFHHANSYYDADTDCMVIVCVRLDKFPEFDKQAGQGDRPFVELDMTEQPVAKLWRYDVNMTDGTHRQRCLAERQIDFPSVHPAFEGRKARYVYGGASLHPTESRPLQCVAKYDMETGQMRLWSRGPRYFMGEPQFIPRQQSQVPNVTSALAGPHGNGSGPRGNGSESAWTHSAEPTSTSSSDSLPQTKEDDGWVLAVGFDAELQQSEVVLLNASDIEAGPIATLPLQNPVGYGLHGSWVPAYYGP